MKGVVQSVCARPYCEKNQAKNETRRIEVTEARLFENILLVGGAGSIRASACIAIAAVTLAGL